MSQRVAKSVRLDPHILNIGLQLAKKLYGSEKRFGYVVDDAVRLLHQKETDPANAQAYLSNIENTVIRSLEKRIQAIGDQASKSIEQQVNQATNRTGNLLAKMTYETSLISLMQEELCFRAIPDYKEDVEPKLRKEAAQRMKTRFKKESDLNTGSAAEENEQLRHDLAVIHKTLEETKQQLKQTKKAFQYQEEEITRLKQELFNTEERTRSAEEQLKDARHLRNWTRGLINHMIENYNRLKKNDALINEYTQINPRPKGL